MWPMVQPRLSGAREGGEAVDGSGPCEGIIRPLVSPEPWRASTGTGVSRDGVPGEYQYATSRFTWEGEKLHPCAVL
jgi:hypothetical protein